MGQQHIYDMSEEAHERVGNETSLTEALASEATGFLHFVQFHVQIPTGRTVQGTNDAELYSVFDRRKDLTEAACEQAGKEVAHEPKTPKPSMRVQGEISKPSKCKKGGGSKPSKCKQRGRSNKDDSSDEDYKGASFSSCNPNPQRTQPPRLARNPDPVYTTCKSVREDPVYLEQDQLMDESDEYLKLVREMVDAGELTKEQAQEFINSFVITEQQRNAAAQQTYGASLLHCEDTNGVQVPVLKPGFSWSIHE